MSISSSLGADTRRLELYIRSSLYLLLLAEPLMLASGLARAPLLVVAVLVHTAGNLAVCRWSLTDPRPRLSQLGVRGRVALAAWGLLSLGLSAVTATATLGDLLLAAPVVVLGTSLGSIACVLGHRTILGAVGLAAVVSALAVVERDALDSRLAVAGFVGSAAVLVGVVYSFWLSGWMIRVVRELVEARHRAGQLAVAEERLRIARDLHDLFGRTLAAVALKSELAAELLRRNRPEQAAAEIAAVRALADQTGVEVRQVVRGVRQVDLGEELVGARALLDSAGIRCVVHEAGAERLPGDVAGALAWVLREAVTNVIRHSRAAECFITLAAEDPVRLTVTNDGAPTGAAGNDGAGTGLVGMAERLEAVGGVLVRHHVGERFSVEARVPAIRAHREQVRT